MAQFTAASITETLTGFDNIVRKTLEDGRLEGVDQKEEHIVSFNPLLHKDSAYDIT